MDEQTNILANNIITAYIAQMDSALKISEILAEHNNNKSIDADEIIGGLIYRLMVPMSDEEMLQSMNKANEIMDISESDGESDGESDEENNIEYSKISDEPRKIRVNQCNCNICKTTRECILKYDEYIPNDNLAYKFKQSIKDTCNKHNLII